MALAFASGTLPFPMSCWIAFSHTALLSIGDPMQLVRKKQRLNTKCKTLISYLTLVVAIWIA